MLTILEIIKKTTDFFAGKGVESPRLNAELLIGHALGLKRMALYMQFERPLAEADLERIRPLVRRRAQREPLQYIVGETEFRGLKVKVDRRALIPRPETELLVEHALGACSVAPARALDLGTGSGAIALALAREVPSCAVVAADASAEALALAQENAVSCGVSDRITFISSNWFEDLADKAPFDLVVSNPPYLSEQETADAAPEVRLFEPKVALTAGDRGLSDLRVIIGAGIKHLVPGGLLALETGISQHAELLSLAKEIGYVRSESRQDLTSRDRYLLLWA